MRVKPLYIGFKRPTPPSFSDPGLKGSFPITTAAPLTVLFGEDQRAKMLGHMIGISVHDTRGLPA